MLRILVSLLFVTTAACVGGNVCERQLTLEDEECFPELEQSTMVDREDCEEDRKAYARCAVHNKNSYCDYFLWQNRAAARLEGYSISDSPPPNNEFLACLDEEGLRDR